MSNFNIRKFLTENKLTEASRSNKVTQTVWTRQGDDPVHDPYTGKGMYIPTITFNGEEYKLDYDDSEPGTDSGTVLMTYTTDRLPGYEFTILGADYGPSYVLDPTYYDENDWDVLVP